MTIKIKEIQNKVKELRQLVRSQEKKIKRMQSLSERDFLTGAYNRQGFINQVEKFLKQFKASLFAERRRSFVVKDVSIIFIDLDGMKDINDTLGHKAGDYALKRAAIFFQKSIRKIDILSRWGGDEFVIALLNFEQKKAFEIAERMRKKLSNLKINFKNNKIKITASFGVICNSSKKYNQKTYSLYNLIDKADEAMYRAKKNFKKNKVVSI